MKRKFIAITVLLCALGCLCSCTQKDVTPTSAPTAQQTTEAPKKTLTADEVVALIHDKFDTEKENCRFEEISSGTSVTVYEDGTSEKENTGKTRTAFKKENGKISFRLDVESDSDVSNRSILFRHIKAVGQRRWSIRRMADIPVFHLRICPHIGARNVPFLTIILLVRLLMTEKIRYIRFLLKTANRAWK